jgi:hypothetical protein
MTFGESLSLPEEILLLALHDEKGTTGIESMYAYAVGGAILSELLMSGRIVLDSSKKKLVRVISQKPLRDALLNDCLLEVQKAKKAKSAETWVSKFAGVKDLKHRLAIHLCDRGILKAHRDKILLLFSRRIYPEIDPRPERELIDRLRDAIFSEKEGLDPRTVVLVALADSGGLLRLVFDKKDLKTRKDRIARIVSGDLAAQATKEAIEAIQAAVFVACMVPAITTTVITN